MKQFKNQNTPCLVSHSSPFYFFVISVTLFFNSPSKAASVSGTASYNGTTIVFQFYKPDSIKTGTAYPIIIALHGAGEVGKDNNAQLKYLGNVASANWLSANPAYVLIPQCPSGSQWANGNWGPGVYSQETDISGPLGAVVHALDSLEKALPIDKNREYITGMSMGGMGTWDLMMRYPNRFAAAIPVCGAIDTTRLDKIAAMPIWTYHGSADPVVSPHGTQTAMRKYIEMGQKVALVNCGVVAPQGCQPLTGDALTRAATASQKIYTEYAGAFHDIWYGVYGGKYVVHGNWTDFTPDIAMVNWMFKQTKGPATTAIRANKKLNPISKTRFRNRMEITARAIDQTRKVFVNAKGAEIPFPKNYLQR